MHSSRIDQARERVEQLRAQLKEEVTAEVVAEQRRARWRRLAMRLGGCCLVYLLGLATVASLGAYAAARSGLVTVPVFTARVAHESAPTRIVAPALTDLDRTLGVAVRNATLRGTRADGVTLTLTEGELTALLRAAIAQQSDVPAMARTSAQVTVVGTAVELYARVPRGDTTTTVLLRGTPRVTEHGALVVEVQRAVLGTMPLPSFLATALLTNALNRLHPPFAIRSVVLADQQLTATIVPASPP